MTPEQHAEICSGGPMALWKLLLAAHEASLSAESVGLDYWLEMVGEYEDAEKVRRLLNPHVAPFLQPKVRARLI